MCNKLYWWSKVSESDKKSEFDDDKLWAFDDVFNNSDDKFNKFEFRFSSSELLKSLTSVVSWARDMMKIDMIWIYEETMMTCTASEFWE